ncbi:MAG: hypothetical protein ACK56F_08585 [bacterium]
MKKSNNLKLENAIMATSLSKLDDDHRQSLLLGLLGLEAGVDGEGGVVVTNLSDEIL